MTDATVSYHELPYGKTVLTYAVHRSARESLRVSVYPDRRVEVHAPHWATDADVERRVRRRAAWIKRQLDFFLSFEPRYELKEYVPGETHRYLGRRYRIRWVPTANDGAAATCQLRGGFYEVRSGAREEIRGAVEAWFAARAEVQLPKIAAPWLALFDEVHQVRPAKLSIRPLRVRWGSCTPSGRVTLNRELIHHPRACIEYVVVHELCHLVEPNHTARFWALLGRMLPDWEGRKGRLERG